MIDKRQTGREIKRRLIAAGYPIVSVTWGRGTAAIWLHVIHKANTYGETYPLTHEMCMRRRTRAADMRSIIESVIGPHEEIQHCDTAELGC